MSCTQIPAGAWVTSMLRALCGFTEVVAAVETVTLVVLAGVIDGEALQFRAVDITRIVPTADKAAPVISLERPDQSGMHTQKAHHQFSTFTFISPHWPACLC